MKTSGKFVYFSVALVFFILNGALVVSDEPQSTGARDKLTPLRAGAVKLDGYLGKKIEQCIENRVMLHDANSLVEPFRTHKIEVGKFDRSGYHGEFIGKWLCSAALGCRYEPHAALDLKMQQAARELMKTQFANGYISRYKIEDEFKEWDVWNLKYVLMGLISQYDQTGNKEYLQAAQRCADRTLEVNGPGKRGIEQDSHPYHKGGVNYSLLEPIVLLYERTGEKRYFDFANYIVDSWSKPSQFTENGIHILEDIESRVPYIESLIVHTYTLMSLYEGVCELYRAGGNEQYLSTIVKAAEKIIAEELMVVGSMANSEHWCRGALTQTATLGNPMETCATVTWIKLCDQLLRLTGDSRWADHMEIALYNALLGAMTPEGEWWGYSSMICGERLPSGIMGLEMSCCVANGPRGLLLTPLWGAMAAPNGEPVINLYAEGTASFSLAEGKQVNIVQKTDYPVSGLVTMTVNPQEAATFTLKLRIPQWSRQTSLKVNGQPVACAAGGYAEIRRQWKAGDIVQLALDFRGRVLGAPSGEQQLVLMRGPSVLALDNRLAPQGQTDSVWLVSQRLPWTAAANNKYVLPTSNFPEYNDAYRELTRVDPNDKDIFMAFEVPFMCREAPGREPVIKKLLMCDFASAGNQWSTSNLYRVWMPQPMCLTKMYVSDTWRTMSFQSSNPRSRIPAWIQDALKEKNAPANP